MTRLLVSIRALSVILTLSFVTGPSAQALTLRQELGAGLDIWAVTVPSGPTAAISLELNVGLADEPLGKTGDAAALLATLVAGATKNFFPKRLHALAVTGGLTTHATLGPRTVILTLVGPTASLKRAAWLVTERLRGLRVRKSDVRALRAFIWQGHESTQYQAVSRRGPPLDIVLGAALAETGISTPFQSRLSAAMMDAETFAKRVNSLLARAAARIIITGPRAELGTTKRAVKRWLAPFLTGLDATERRAWSNAIRRRRTDGPPARRRVQLQHRRDGRTVVGAAWELTPPPHAAPGRWAPWDAALSVWMYRAERRIGGLHAVLTGTKGVGRALKVRLVSGAVHVLGISLESRGRNAKRTLAALLGAFDAMLKTPISKTRLWKLQDGTLRLQRRLRGDAGYRVSLIGMLIRGGRLSTRDSYNAWVRRFDAAIRNLTPAAFTRFAQRAFGPQKRVEAVFVPTGGHGAGELALTARHFDIVRQLAVDRKCPRPGTKVEQATLLKEKYGLTVAQYATIRRQLIAWTVNLPRRMGRWVTERCAGYKRLRAMMTYDRIISLHQSVACKVGPLKGTRAKESALKKVAKTFKVDVSFIRPLVEMAYEDLTARAKLRAIDAQCPSTFSLGSSR